MGRLIRSKAVTREGRKPTSSESQDQMTANTRLIDEYRNLLSCNS